MMLEELKKLIQESDYSIRSASLTAGYGENTLSEAFKRGACRLDLVENVADLLGYKLILERKDKSDE